jgi:hypothetical protein
MLVSAKTNMTEMVLRSMVQTNIKIRSAPDGKGKFKKVVQVGRLRTVGALARQLLYAFDFGGVGVNTGAIGISLTYVPVEVIKLSLSRIGTQDVAMDTIGTGCVSLLGTDNLTKEQKGELVPKETAGFDLLAGALIDAVAEECEMNSVSITQLNPCKEVLSDIVYLGSSGSCHVFRLNGKGFAKMPRSAAREDCLA